MFELISLDNKESKGQSFVGKTHFFKFDGYQVRFGSMTTSRVESIVKNEDGNTVVKTKNSTYIFKNDSK